MGTNIRPEISDNNKYVISKHRYYELVHFCRQYPDYKKEYRRLSDQVLNGIHIGETSINSNSISNPTQDYAIKLERIGNKIEDIDTSCIESDPLLSDYLLMAVTKGTSYVNLSTVHNIPCSKNTFYDRYRKFFWILDKKREARL